MTINDTDFARVLNHLHRMSTETRFEDDKLAEGLIRAAVVLLAVRDGPNEAVEAKARDLLQQSIVWCRRMTAASRVQRKPRSPCRTGDN